MAPRSRGWMSPSFASSFRPLVREGAGKAGCRPAPAVRCAKCTRRKNRTAAYRCGRTPGLPCAVVGRLMPCSPGSRCFFLASLTLAEVAGTAPVGTRPHPQGLTVANDGQDHTVLPYALSAVRTTRLAKRLTGVGSILCPPCPSHPRRRCPRPPHPRPTFDTTYDRPSPKGRDGGEIPHFRISVKWNIFAGRG